MNAQDFADLCRNRYVYLDGATGSNLMRAGMPAGVCPEQWIIEHRDVMLSLQKEYVAAGTNILYAPTFTANRLKLREYGLESRQEQMIRELVAISKEAAQGKAYVAGDLTMTGAQLAPIGTLDFEELVDVYKEQIRYLADAGVDLLVVETMMSLQETRAALIAAKETCSLPVMATLTFEKDGRTLFGTDAVTAVITLQSLGAAAVGANCSCGPEQMLPVIRDMVRAAKVPIIAKPNAGMPILQSDGTTEYSMNAEEFAGQMRMLADAGATVLGGCCGTTPAHIREMVKGLPKEAQSVLRAADAVADAQYYLTCERRTVSFDLAGPFLIVGERINPTGKKKLQAQLKEENFELVSSFAAQQEEMGASVLDVNMGMPGIDEKRMMLRAIEEVTAVCDLPLSVDSSHIEVIEAALRRYPGRALINSVSLESAKCEPLLAIAAKYGAMILVLPLSDAGIPATLQERVQIMEQIVEKAAAFGLTKQDIIVDGLVMTVGADPGAAKLTLDMIRTCREMGYATTCGLSNISFGLPERSYVNAAFLTMAIQNGLTMAIANPSQRLLMCTAFAADLLLAKEGAAARYIEYTDFCAQKEAEEQARAEATRQSEIARGKSETDAQTVQNAAGNTAAGQNALQRSAAEQTVGKAVPGGERQLPESLVPVYQAVLKGRRAEISRMTQALTDAGEAPQDILNLALMPAIDEVGVLFDKGKYFLPQLIGSAEAMKDAIAVLEPLLAEGQDAAELATVVIATVKGDIHDIGKNLVALMLKNHGFRVIDLGKDVDADTIVQTAVKEHAQVIALSALMTTTMMQMKTVVQAARREIPDCKIVIGGAVTTADFANEIGADGYSKDAAEAVTVIKRLLEL